MNLIEYKEKDNNLNQDASVSCNNGCITKCIALKRIISMLSFYHNNDKHHDALSMYLAKYTHLIDDYHHILDKHLNEDNISRIQSNEQFKSLHQQMNAHKLLCDVAKCNIYSRNNRQRETTHIECNDKLLAVYIDILDSIHCHFLHSVDVGYRLIDIPVSNENKVNDTLIESNAYDSEMTKIKTYLKQKRKILLTARDKNRMNKTKFITNLSGLHQQHEDKNDNKENNAYDTDRKDDVYMEGYLHIKSLYLKQLQKRWVVLNDGILCCYKTENKNNLAQSIQLEKYKEINHSQRKLGQIVLIPKRKKDSIRTFATESIDEAEVWINAIRQCLQTDNENEQKYDVNEYDAKEFSFGVASYYNFLSKKRGKYKSIKQEVTSNKIFSISMAQFNAAYDKAQYLVSQSPKIRNMREYQYLSKKNGYVKGSYFIPPDFELMAVGDAPTIENIISVVLYTDYDSLSYRFSSTFRKVLHSESDKYTAKRNEEFWNWTKILTETVHTFGTEIYDSKVSVFYHGISFMHFNAVWARFNSPISTTTNLQVAASFAVTGLILELGKIGSDYSSNFRNGYKHNRKRDTKYFNCSFVSAFPQEDERLFIHTKHPLHILSIRNMSTDENYQKYIRPMNVFQQLFDSGESLKTCNLSFAQRVEFAKVINEFISILCGNDNKETPDYISQILKKWSKRRKKVSLWHKTTQRFVPDIDLYHPQYKDLPQLVTLNVMFKSITAITLWETSFILTDVLESLSSMLNAINQLPYSKLDLINIIYYPHNGAEKALFFKNIRNIQKHQTLIRQCNWSLEANYDKSESVVDNTLKYLTIKRA